MVEHTQKSKRNSIVEEALRCVLNEQKKHRNKTTQQRRKAKKNGIILILIITSLLPYRFDFFFLFLAKVKFPTILLPWLPLPARSLAHIKSEMTSTSSSSPTIIYSITIFYHPTRSSSESRSCYSSILSRFFLLIHYLTSQTFFPSFPRREATNEHTAGLTSYR